MVKKISKSKLRFFKHLMRDQGGNTIIFVGASLIPLLALIGGGVDASRGYMAKARLQQACDAATLAGRREVGNGTFTIIAQQQANRLFEANFERGFLGSDPAKTTFVTRSGNGGNTVIGQATTSIPTVIMRIFGNPSVELNVTCTSSLSIANADVMMILDTTGSMAFDAAGNDLGTDTSGNALPGSRMFDLRSAATSFYDVVEQASNNTGARIRYGFVPYSTTVNVGKLLVEHRNGNLVIGQNNGETVTYPARRPLYYTVGNQISNNTIDATINGGTAFIERNDCVGYGLNMNFQPGTNNTVRVYNSARALITETPFANPFNPIIDEDALTITTYSNGTSFGNGFIANGQFRQQCRRNVEVRRIVTTFDGNTPGARFLRWEYRNLDIPVDNYVRSITNGMPVTPPTNLPSGFFEPDGFDPEDVIQGDFPASVWEGCIEERSTVAAEANEIRFNRNTGIAPSAATDLNIDDFPSSDSTKWAPLWPEVSYNRRNDTNRNYVRTAVATQGEKANAICPQPAKLMQTLSRNDFINYLESLKPSGATYHDLGLIWGARLSSPTGIFADNVNDPAPNNGFVSRNIIFLTDGELVSNRIGHTAYGTEFQNPRAGPFRSNAPELNAIHDARFLAVCEAAKSKGIRVFVVAFGTGLSPSLQRCASVNSAFEATDSTQLNQTFLDIASNIADLRLTN